MPQLSRFNDHVKNITPCVTGLAESTSETFLVNICPVKPSHAEKNLKVLTSPMDIT